MNILTVNKKTCLRDSRCALSCPAALIIAPPGEYPEPIANAEAWCLRCGHCVAVCPAASLSHREMPIEELSPVREELLLSKKQVDQFLRARRSIRAYKKKTVPSDRIRNLIELARYAPTGRNSQGVEWLVMSDRSELRRLSSLIADWMRWEISNASAAALSMPMDKILAAWEAGQDVFLRGAPAVIVAHAEKDDRRAPTSCTIALAYLELAAVSQGLGCCWAGYFTTAATVFTPMQEALSLPVGHMCFGALMIGYPRFGYPRIPSRRPPRIIWR